MATRRQLERLIGYFFLGSEEDRERFLNHPKVAATELGIALDDMTAMRIRNLDRDKMKRVAADLAAIGSEDSGFEGETTMSWAEPTDEPTI